MLQDCASTGYDSGNAITPDASRAKQIKDGKWFNYITGQRFPSARFLFTIPFFLANS